MNEPERLAAALTARLKSYDHTGDPTTVTGLDTLAEAAHLARLVTFADLSAMDTLCRLFLIRFTLRPDSDSGQSDLATAITVAQELTHGQPDNMPSYLRDGLQRYRFSAARYARAAGQDHQQRLDRAKAVLTDPRRTPTHLRQAIEDSRFVHRYTPVMSPGYSLVLSVKAAALQQLHDMQPDPALLTEAETTHREALAVDGPGTERHGEVLFNLLSFLLIRWRSDHDPAIPPQCADLGARLLAATTPDVPGRPWMQLWGGGVLRTLGAETGNPQLQTNALKLLQAAARCADQRGDTPLRAKAAHAIAATLVELYQAGHRGLPALAEALDESRLLATMTDDPDQPLHLDNALRLALEYVLHTGDTTQLREAIGWGRQAIEATTDPARRRSIHASMTTAHTMMHKLTLEPDWLWQTVISARNATPPAGTPDPDTPARLTALCKALIDHYEIQPYSTNLEEAILAGRRASQECPPDDPARGHHLYQLGRAYFAAAARAADPALKIAMTRAAVLTADQAIDASPATDRTRWDALLLLGGCLYLSWGVEDRLADLIRAVDVTRQAVDLPAPSPNARILPLSNLAAYLLHLGKTTNDTGLLNEALGAARRAVTTSPTTAGTANLVLGSILQELHRRPDGPPDREQLVTEARTAFGNALTDDALSAADRLRIHRELLWAHQNAGDPAAALHAAEEAVALLPPVSSMLLWRHDRQHGLATTAGLAAEAAGAAITAGRPDRAAELLELTRGTLLNETLDRRGVVARLHAEDPAVADEYDQLLTLIEMFDARPEELVVVAVDVSGVDEQTRQTWQEPALASAGGHQPSFRDSPAEAYRHLYANLEAERRRTERYWEQMLRRVRAVHGFADFMLPPPAAALRRQATAGPIIMINVSRDRGDALIITADDIRAVPLPAVDQSSVTRQLDHLRAARQALSADSLTDRQTGQKSLSTLLAWLWDHITGPALDALGITGAPRPGDPWPRVWWCPTGLATPLPLHAAGHHTTGDRTVLDRVVSSYTPTVRTLQQARREPQTDAGTAPAMLVVAVPEPPTPAFAALPGATREADLIRGRFPHTQVLHGADATYQSVTSALLTHDVVHFVCHGVSDWNNPEASTLVLPDHAEQPLTLVAVAKNHHPGAALAYLSACDTTRTTPRLHDEAIHITSACQLAGYRHVIGTLWPVDDTAATQIAATFYQAATTDDGKLRPERSAHALHQAIRDLRDRCGGRSASLWAAHIHVGP